MFIEFEALPENARVWIYQAHRTLSVSEQNRILETLLPAVDGWVTHGMPMRGSVKILFDRLVVIAADTDYREPSGCSIDSSTRWLQELGQVMNLDFFDRSIGYFEDGEWRFFSVFQARSQVASGIIGPDTKVINAGVASVADLADSLVVPASESFLKRYFLAPGAVDAAS